VSAVQPGDYVRAELDVFRHRVARSREIIERAAEKGRIGVSFSGGKDSLVTLHLVREIVPDAPAVFFDCGTELRATREIVAHYGVATAHPRMTYAEMARFSGWYDYPEPVDKSCPFRVKAVLIDEPSEAFVVRERLSVVAMGLRAEESAGRRANARVRGGLYRGSDRTWYCTPLSWWTVDDVWAYIASRGLRYHPAYDVLTEKGLPREEQRLGMLLDKQTESMGGFAKLKWLEPDTWAEIAREFPGIRWCS
jgi:phosphoadenosine phosphosulfate reductase